MTEEQVFEKVYADYGPALYRFCLLHMKRHSDAEDVLQEVFFKRLYQSPPFETAEHERRWLFRVALNQCRDEWRRKERSNLPLEAAALASAPTQERELLEAVAALPEKQRTALHLHYYEGYSVQEIAAILGVTVSAVKMRMQRGRAMLREQWKEEL